MNRLAITLFSAVALHAAPAFAQRSEFESGGGGIKRAYILVSDGVGVGNTPASGSGGLLQLFRVSGLVALTQQHGIEVSAIRIQDIVPPSLSFQDPYESSHEADGLILSYAGLSAPRGGGFPAVFSIGGGVLRRANSDTTTTDTWGAQIGLEGKATNLGVSWAELTGGLRIIVMPSLSRGTLYMGALSFGIRIG